MKGFIKRTFDDNGEIATESAPMWKLNPDASTDSAAATVVKKSNNISSSAKRPRTSAATDVPLLRLCTFHRFLTCLNLTKTASSFAEETGLMPRICTALFRGRCLKTLESLRLHGVADAQPRRVASANDILAGAALTSRLPTDTAGGNRKRKRKKELYENVSQCL